jgi:hypothetical protein
MKINKPTQLDRMGVLVLVAHLLVTLAMFGIYAFFSYIGKPVTTIENMLLIVVGYWFGAIGKETIRPTQQTQIQHANEVKTAATEKSEV